MLLKTDYNAMAKDTRVKQTAGAGTRQIENEWQTTNTNGDNNLPTSQTIEMKNQTLQKHS